MLNWANRFNIFCLLQSNGYRSTPQGTHDFILAVGAKEIITLPDPVDYYALKQFSLDHSGWIFGHLNYPSHVEDPCGFPQACFFLPEHVLTIREESIEVLYSDMKPDELIEMIVSCKEEIASFVQINQQVNHHISKSEYLEKLDLLKGHLQRGDCYEINFCQGFFINDIQLDPLSLYQALNEISPNPFASLYKLHNSYCICASPERFLKRQANKIISQPIKGTLQRDLSNADNDAKLKKTLEKSEKDRSENVMIVDLVRNDLSKICTEGSVKVPELFGIHSFPQVHHMISTIEGEVESDKHWTEIIDACFPMGSMTGAPKKKVMELIANYEATPRGLFSGTIGYVSPSGDFDFNVVIRSIFYNQAAQQLRFLSGGGITIHSEPELEYEESMAKSAAIRKLLSNT